MSEDNEADTTSCCASCGIAEVDDVKLKDCDGCDLVRYCSDECQRDHKSQHEEACKKRAADMRDELLFRMLRDELLFRQPESTHMGDCPICSLPMPLDRVKSTMHECCSKVICNGCNSANKIRELGTRTEESCPFCREPSPRTDEESDKRRMKRVEANDPGALLQEGLTQGIKGDYVKAFKYLEKAADLGVAEAHYRLACMYNGVKGVKRDKGKKIYHLEEAAIGGHPNARFELGCHEGDNNNIARAVKHWIISATQGEDKSIKALLMAFKQGQKDEVELVSKEDLDSALRAHKEAVDATKSPQRREAEEIQDFFRAGGIPSELPQIRQYRRK